MKILYVYEKTFTISQRKPVKKHTSVYTNVHKFALFSAQLMNISGFSHLREKMMALAKHRINTAEKVVRQFAQFVRLFFNLSYAINISSSCSLMGAFLYKASCFAHPVLAMKSP